MNIFLLIRSIKIFQFFRLRFFCVAFLCCVQGVVGYNTYAGILYSTFTTDRMCILLYDDRFNYDYIIQRHLQLH